MEAHEAILCHGDWYWHQLLIIKMNDLDINRGGMIGSFIDVTKIGGAVDNNKDSPGQLDNVDEVIKCAEQKQKEFNPNVMQCNGANKARTHTVNHRALESI